MWELLEEEKFHRSDVLYSEVVTVFPPTGKENAPQTKTSVMIMQMEPFATFSPSVAGFS